MNEHRPLSAADLAAMEIILEEKIRSEYSGALKKLEDDRRKFDRQQSQWNNVVQVVKANLISSGKYAEDDEAIIDADAVMSSLIGELTDYYKFKKMLEYIEANPLLKSQWDKLVMSIRLTGGDQNDNDL